MVKRGFCCGAFIDVVIKPFGKERRKPNNDSHNFKVIAPNASLAELLDYIITDVIKSYYQIAYKSSFSTTLYSFMP